MARPTLHTTLGDLGFKLIDRVTKDPGGKNGPVTSMHYAMSYRSPGSAVPTVHHIVLNEFQKNPGKYNASYHVNQAGQPYSDGELDTVRYHKLNALRGSSDPLGEIIQHHKNVTRILDSQKPPAARRPADGELLGMSPEFMDKGAPMQYLNAVVDGDAPLDAGVYRLLTGGGKGRPQFEYLGRIEPGDPHTDVYRADYEDPEDPSMRYGFTVRHMPSAKPEKDTQVGKSVTRGVKHVPINTPKARVFSYNATHYPAGEDVVGQFGDVTGEGSSVANFTSVGPLLERHKNVLRSLGLMALPPRDPRPDWHFTASGPVSDADWESFVAGRNPVQGMMPDGTPVVDHFDPNFGHDESNSRGGSHRVYDSHAVAGGPSGEPEVYEPRGNCVTCGRPTWNTRDGGEVPNWEDTGSAHYAEEYGMHGPDIPQCVNCYNEYDTHKEAVRAGERPGGLWHHPGARINSCPECLDHVMNDADEDLAP